MKKIVGKCVTCKRFKGRSFLGPPPPSLPKFRLKEDLPFTHTGVDFTRLLYVKTNRGDVIDRSKV